MIHVQELNSFPVTMLEFPFKFINSRKQFILQRTANIDKVDYFKTSEDFIAQVCISLDKRKTNRSDGISSNIFIKKCDNTIRKSNLGVKTISHGSSKQKMQHIEHRQLQASLSSLYYIQNLRAVCFYCSLQASGNFFQQVSVRFSQRFHRR